MFETLIISLITCFAINVTYQLGVMAQNKVDRVWCNPMLIALLIIIPVLHHTNIPFSTFEKHSQYISWLLEPAIVALGYPLYLQIKNIKNDIHFIFFILTFGVITVLTVSLLFSVYLLERNDIAVSLALKSITTPIGLALTERLQGVSSITAIAIIIAGLTGALIGPTWLNLIHVNSPKAQGLAIGAASHVLGTTVISKISYQHGAYGSLALIISAIITAIIAPVIIPYLL